MEGERGRNKARLEAGLSWLCELEVLKRRQEALVLGALALEDGCPAWGDAAPAREQLTLRRQLSRLQGAPSLLMLALQQQLSELRLETGLTGEHSSEDDLDSPSACSSGFYEQSESLSPPLRSCSSPNLSVSSHRPRSVDGFLLDWEGHVEPTLHPSLPRSFSAPYPPLEGIAEEEDDEEIPQWASDHTAEGNDSLPSDAELDPAGRTDEGPTEEDIQQAMRVEAYILGLLQRRHLQSGLSSDPEHWRDFDSYPSGYPHLHQPEWQEWATLSEEENEAESQDGYYMNIPGTFHVPHEHAQIGPTSLSSEEPESSLETDHYGAEEVYTSSTDSPGHQPLYIQRRTTMSEATKAHVHPCCNHTCVPTASAPESREQLQPVPAQKWALLRALTARRALEEQWTTAGERQSRMSVRSRSEDSAASQAWAAQPEHKYYTVGRDMGRHHSEEFYPSGQRLWSSSADLSQEEDEGIFREDMQEFAHTHLPLKHTSVQFMERDERERDRPEASAPTDGSDSSLSETFSPGTSSVSSDSDESGGLVWPQQLPPRLPPSSSESPSSALVKIKASHALKKKIMRFRSGSLKLMTTV